MPDIPIQSLQVFGDDPDRYARQIFTDSLVKQTRDATPPDVANQRATPRLSIGELNSLDLPAIKTRYQSTKLDSRGPVTRFLDLLDLPRNAIANIVFPGEAAAMKESGETGTFGMGKVTFSDALRKMGVENRVALAVGGFVGDVLMDPLTYVGPAGWGAKGVSSAGKVTSVIKTGAKVRNASRLEAIAGQAIRDPDIAGFMKSAGLDADGIANLRKSGKTQKEIEKLVNDEIGGQGQTRFNKWLRAIGGDIESKEGLLGKADPFGLAETAASQEQRQFAMNFANRFGEHAKPGVRIGRDSSGKMGVEFAKAGEVGRIPSGSTVAHIPFTDIGIHVPAFTDPAKGAIAYGSLLGAKEASIGDTRLNQGLKAYKLYADNLSELKDNFRALQDLDEADVAAGHQPMSANLDTKTPYAGTNPELYAQLTERNNHLVEWLGRLDEQNVNEFGKAADEAAQGLKEPGEILAYGRLKTAFSAAKDKFKADVNDFMSENAGVSTEWKRLRNLIGPRAENETVRRVQNAESVRQGKARTYADGYRTQAIADYEEANRLRAEGDAIAEPYKGLDDAIEKPSTPGPAAATPTSVPNDPSLPRPWEMTKAQFANKYRQHNILREDAPDVGPEGWKSGIGPNVVGVTQGPPSDVMQRKYGTQAGRPIYLVPKEWVRETRNGAKIKDGWKPTGADKYVPTRDHESVHEMVLRRAIEEGKTVPENVLKEYPDLKKIKGVSNGLENTPASGRDIPVSMQDGGVSGNAGEGSGVAGRVEPETGPATGSSPKSRRARTEEFTRSGIATKLEKEARGYEDATTDVYMDDADGVVVDNWSGAFKGELPDEVVAYLKENPKDAKYFTANSPGGMGEDSLLKTDSSGVADLVAKIKNQGVTAAANNRLELLRTDPSRPDAHFLFDLQDRLKGLAQRAKSDAKPALEPFSVVGGDGYRVMRGPKYGEYRAAQINEKTGKQKSYSKQRFTNIVDAILAHPPKDLQEILAQTKSLRQRKMAVKDWIRTNKSVLANEIDNPPKIGSIRSPQLRVIDKPHDVLNVGTKFKTAGMDYRVSLAENGDKILVDANNKQYALGAFDSLPIDKDSLDLAEQIVPPPAIPDELAQFGQQADAFPSSTAFESEAAEAMRLRKLAHDQADAIADKARASMETADEIESGKAAEEFAKVAAKHDGSVRPKGLSENAGWKLHLAVDPANQDKVDAMLSVMGVQYKRGHNSGQVGKDFTIYIGSKDNANKAASHIESWISPLLRDPEGESLIDDIPFGNKVMGRFDAAGDQSFHQYGTQGFPYLVDDMNAATFDPSSFDATAAAKRANDSLTRKYGAFYAGRDEALAQSELNTLRQRYGDMPQDLIAPVDEAGIRAQAVQDAITIEKQNVDAARQWILDVSPETAAARENVADLLDKQLRAAKSLADAINAPIAQTMTGTSRNLVRAAEMALGVDPGMIGVNAFMGAATATNGLFGDTEVGAAFDRWMRAAAYGLDKGRRMTIGERSGNLHELDRMIHRETRRGGQTLRVQLAEHHNRVASIAKHHGLKATDHDELQKLIYLSMYNVRHNADPVFAADSPIWDSIVTAEKNGWFNDKMFPGLRGDIEQYAEQNIDMLDDFGDEAVRMGVLSRKETSHVSTTLTQEARQAVRTMKQNAPAGLSGGAKQAMGTLEESFEKSRTSYRQSVVGPDGKEIGSFMLGQRDFAMAFNADDLAVLDDMTKNEIVKIQELVRYFDESVARGELQPSMQRLDAFHLNKLVADEGMYTHLIGGKELNRGFFETNAAMVMANRSGSQERTRLRLMADAVVDAIEMPINNEKFAKLEQNGAITTFRFNNGVEGKFYPATPKSPAYVELGNQRWRKIDQAAIAKSHDILGLTRSKFLNSMVPEMVAERIENIYRGLATEDDIKGFMQAADQFTGIWKGVTLLHPSWTVGNLLGGMIQMLSMGVSPAMMAKHAMNAAKITFHGHNPEALAKILVNAGQSGEMSGMQILKDLDEGRAVHAGQSAEAFAHALLKDGQVVMPNTYSLLKNPKMAGKEMHEHALMRARASAAASMFSKVKGYEKLSYAKAMVIDEAIANRVYKPWFGVNGKAEDWMRTVAYLALRDKGMDASSASNHIVEGMFDFADLTNFEMTYLRRLLPFYAWMRNSAAYGVKMLAENPKYYSLVPKTRDAMEEMFAGEERVPMHLRPRWMREQLALQIGADPESRSALMAGSYLPQEGGMRLASAFASPLMGQAALQDGIAYLGMGINPLMRVPLEVAAGREFYTGRVIAGDENQGDLTVGEHLANQVRPFREFGVGQTRQGALPAAFDRSFGEGVTRSLIGGRSQPFTEERLTAAKKREFDERVANIRKKINLAEREKKPEASLRARTALLQTYAEMKKAGAKIPKWAESQLVEVEN